MIKNIEFDYTPAISEGETHTVQAKVSVGKGSARSDSPTEVIELSLFDWNGNDLSIDDDTYEDLCERAIEMAVQS